MIRLLSLFFCVTFALATVGPYWWYDETNTLADRPTMVHLFEWKWTDVAKECENFLQYYNYGAVQVSPPNEHIMFVRDNNMPWYIRYQPVSYKLYSRSGSRDEFINMVNRCNRVGVRIIADVVVNHMVGMGAKKGVNGFNSSGPSDFDGTEGIETFPGVPYDRSNTNDAKCNHDIQPEDYQHNAYHVKVCRLVGLIDLDHKQEHVREKIVEYFNDLIDIGVAGFRIDASKHMYGSDLKIILDRVKNLRSDIFGENHRPFAVHEVIDRGGEACTYKNYIDAGRYTNFNFGAAVSAAAKRYGGNFKDLAYMGPGFGYYGNGKDHDVLAFIDNHDNQRDDNTYAATYKDGNRYEMAVGYMLAWTYGFPRVMSSYYFNNRDQGPPNYGPLRYYETKGPTFRGDGTCDPSSGWVCEHRWPSIRRMSLFRRFTAGTAVTETVTDDNRVAFAREGKGYFAVNNGYGTWFIDVQTTLAPGAYCDLYTGERISSFCSGATIYVTSDGKASITVPEGRFVAFHVGTRLSGLPSGTVIPASWQTTVILIKKHTEIGEYMFLRGGNTQNGKACYAGPKMQQYDPCAIPIAHITTTPFLYAEYRMWSQADAYLDFEGVEAKQGTHDGRLADGTPLAYSTNDKTALEYQPYNTFGPDYWMVVLKMDCSKTANGWFDLKGYETPNVGWEKDIKQGACKGDITNPPLYVTNNHMALCGHLNVFEFNNNVCIINKLP